MKKFPLLLILFSLFSSFSSYTQDTNVKDFHKSIFELGLGLGTSFPIERYASTAILHVDAKYHFRNFTFGLSTNQHLFGFGVDRPVRRELNISRIVSRDRFTHSLRSFKSFVDFCPRINNFQPIIGIGYGLHFRPEILITIFDENDMLIRSMAYEKQSVTGFIFRFGYRFKKWVNLLEFNLLPDKFYFDGLLSHFNFVLIREFGLHKPYQPLNEYFTKIKKEKREIFILNIGLLTSMPISQRYKADATRIYAEAKISLPRNLMIGLKIETTGGGSNYDKSLTELVEFAPDDYRGATGSGVAHISSYQIIGTYQLFKEKSMNFYSGIGLGVFDFRNLSVYNTYARPNIPKKTNFGGSLLVGYQYAMMNSYASLNFPGKGIPVHFNLGLGFSFKLKKRIKTNED